MNERTRKAEQSKAAILEAARRLFAEREIAGVSIRDIAAAAGVSHGLVRQYFGNREAMVSAIIQREIDAILAAAPPAEVDTDQLRRFIRDGMESFQDFAPIIARAELAGIEPEKMLGRRVTTPAKALASAIAHLQAKNGVPPGSALDPRLVSAYVNAALFGFGALAPWLMASAGLKPQAYRKQFDGIADITLALIELAGGAPPRQARVRGGAAESATREVRRRK